MKHLVIGLVIFTLVGVALDTILYNAYRWCKGECKTCGNWMCKYAWHME